MKILFRWAPILKLHCISPMLRSILLHSMMAMHALYLATSGKCQRAGYSDFHLWPSWEIKEKLELNIPVSHMALGEALDVILWRWLISMAISKIKVVVHLADTFIHNTIPTSRSYFFNGSFRSTFRRYFFHFMFFFGDCFESFFLL